MYLVTYLGQLCNGLTLLIISKKHTFPGGNICWKSIKRLYGCHVNYFTLFLSPPGVIAVFSLPLLYQRRQVVLQMCSLYRRFLQRFLLSFNSSYNTVISQEEVDSFVEKIQAKFDNIKDM